MTPEELAQYAASDDARRNRYMTAAADLSRIYNAQSYEDLHTYAVIDAWDLRHAVGRLKRVMYAAIAFSAVAGGLLGALAHAAWG